MLAGMLVVVVVVVLVFLGVRVVVVMRVFVSMLVTVAMIVRMLVIVPMVMTFLMPMMLVEHLLRDGIVFRERLVMPMLVATAICTGLRRKRPVRLFDLHAQASQHVGKHGIVFELEIAIADLDRRVPV
jgi:hypothetical protein